MWKEQMNDYKLCGEMQLSLTVSGSTYGRVAEGSV